jgi:hypothetical protein
MFFPTRSNRPRNAFFSVIMIVAFLVTYLSPVTAALAREDAGLDLPAPGTQVTLSDPFTPALIKGVTVSAENPFQFDFILDTGDQDLAGDALKAEATRLIKYFLASLTTPDDEAWVNLSPYEKDRIIAEPLSQTMLGRDLLAQDYILKQISASVSDPHQSLGKTFWKKVHRQAYEQFGVTDIPLNTFNKIWIVPENAVVFEKDRSAFVLKSHLKVLLEEDYAALHNSRRLAASGLSGREGRAPEVVSGVTAPVVKEVLIPAIEKEVNQGETFAKLRQVYHSVILASWYKQALKNSILSQVYVNRNKINGVDVADKGIARTIYEQYVAAFKKGVYNFIQEEYDESTQELIPRKYFSGGLRATIPAERLSVVRDPKALSEEDQAMAARRPDSAGRQFAVTVNALALRTDSDEDLLEELDAAPFVQSADLEDTAMAANNDRVKGALTETIPPTTEGIDFSRHYLERARDDELRVKQIDFILREIEKERAQPGTGQLPRYEVLSDFHGDVVRFTALLSNSLSRLIGFGGQLDHRRSIKEQLDEQGLTLKDMQGAIVLGGDLFDRGEHGIKCALVAMELKRLAPGHVAFIMGNHDKWMEGNMNGLHVPWYEGFHWYLDRGTEKERAFKQKARDMVEAQRALQPDNINSFDWWTKRLAEFNEDVKAYNKTALKGQAKEIRTSFVEFYKEFNELWNDQQLDAMERFAGHFKRISVPDPAMGLNGVANTSVAWWESTYEELRKARDEREQQDASASEMTKWAEAMRLAKQISLDLSKRLQARLDEGKFWYQAFEAINTHAYETEEWWSKDWSSHKGWGEKVIAELNQMIKEGLITDEPYEEYDQSNYIHSVTLKRISDFYADSFNLHFFTIYKDLVSHGWFPVTDSGELEIEYNGKIYRDNKIFAGIDQMTSDVRDPELSFLDKWEARSIVNSWYADMTTQIKPVHIKKNREKIGIPIIHGNLKISNWITGHNTLRKLKTSFMTKSGYYAHFEMDKGMSPKFGEEGGLVSIGPDGIHMWGFEHDMEPLVENIVQAPMSPMVEGKKITSEYENPGLGGEDFLDIVTQLLVHEKAEITGEEPGRYYTANGKAHRIRSGDNDTAMTVDTQAKAVQDQYGGINLDPALINMEIKRDGTGVVLPVDQQPYFNAEIEGLLPVIINVTPVSIPLLMGLKPEDQRTEDTLAAL